jgi:SAM-dependent methyltransferase
VVFDVGCNMGAALLPFREKGHEVAGVDYNAEYIEFGRVKTGIPLQTGGVEALRGHAKKADLIILNHVLEHFIDLGKGLDDIYGMLNPGGYVYVFVPGIFWWVENRCGGDTLGLLQNAHTWQFSLKTLQYVMECAGFEPVFGDERVASIFKKCGGSRRALSDMPSGEFDKIRCWLALAERKYFFKRLKARVLRRG